jgi:hypothetical protein
VNVRPYRHKPELKDEIERQVQEMLDSRVIQLSSSSFFSLTILVRQKRMGHGVYALIFANSML